MGRQKVPLYKHESFGVLVPRGHATSPPPPQRPHIEAVETIVGRLTPPLGTKIRVSPGVRGCLAYLEPHGAPASVALRTLGKALHASVVVTPGEWTLEITAEDRKALEAARVAERASWVQAKMDAVERFRVARLKGRDAGTTILAEVERTSRILREVMAGRDVPPDPNFASDLLPSEGLLLKLVRAIGTDEIAAVPNGEVRVWEEDVPVPGAQPLPPHQAALDAYEKAVGAVRGTSIPRPSGRGSTSWA